MAKENQVEELENILCDAEMLENRCYQGVLRSSEIGDQLRALEERARTALVEDSDPARLFDRHRREITDYWRDTISGYVDEKDCDNIARLVGNVRKVLDLLEPEGLRDAARPKDEFFFSARDQYRPAKQIFKILKRADFKVAIVDEYLDDEVFDYIESLNSSLSINLLTGTKKPIFPVLLHALQTTGVTVEARENTQCHDRFVILDDQEVWHLGASINGIGKSAFMVNRINDEEERKRFLCDFQNWWARGGRI